MRAIPTYKSIKNSKNKTAVKEDAIYCGMGLCCILFACYLGNCAHGQYTEYQKLMFQELDKPDTPKQKTSLLTTMYSKIITNKKASKESEVVYQQLLEKRRTDLLDSSAKGIMYSLLATGSFALGLRLLFKGLHPKD